LDRFFKRVGLSRELQTGDETFDSAIYIESEHDAVRAALSDSAELRRKVLNLFQCGVWKIWCDGRMLHIESRAEQRESGLGALELIRAEIVKHWPKVATASSDTFSSRPRIVRSVMWAIAGYAAAGVVEAVLSRETLHLDQWRLILTGVMAGTLMVGGLAAMTLALLRGASRTHRLAMGIALQAFIVAPMFGMQAISDVNRALDRHPVTVTARVAGRWESGAVSRAYYIRVAEPLRSPFGPRALRVSQDVFRSVDVGMSVPIVIGGGRLDIPWVRSINGVLVK
jgi:hypothetical protein